MADVHNALDTAIYALLSADSTLNVYGIYNTSPPDFDEIPKGEQSHQLPIIIFQLMDAPIASTFGSRGFLCEYMVKAISRSRWPKEATAISSLIDTAMEDASLSVSGFTHLWSVRTGTIYFQETSRQIIYTHAGGIFQLMEAA